ncbi:leucine-rich repeat-containing 24 [Brachionus plicatilis]|uniref:Leucine-rich repeat-containing 24 n=1 Tax=Brachionus plicatilis TaxID=10195 RepID=A0A3M7S6A7_BRAPC|nr:leucine-rich repeat-containing 24 [Brachionus plicatilis]
MIKQMVSVAVLFVILYHCTSAREQSVDLLKINRNLKNTKTHINHPYYIDNSSLCPILFYTALKVVKNCSSLNLAGTNLNFLSENTMSVTELILSNNNFDTSIPYTQINMYATVRTLDLGFNLLTNLNTEIKLINCNQTCIKYLELNHNRFTKIPILSATCANNLIGLNMSHNQLMTNIDQDVDIFPLMASLQNLDLAYSSIEFLNLNNTSIFAKMPNLVYLNMTGNRIKDIQPNPFLILTHLQYLSFDPSLLQCNSSILWLKHFLQMNPRILGIWPNGSLSTRPYQPFCFNILTNQSQNIITSPNTSFYTGIFLTTSIDTRDLSVIEGKTLELDCEKYSVPASDLWWTFNDRVLSKSVNGDSPYEFIENFNQLNTPSLFNKTSVLRIKNIEDKLSGVYSCKAFYLNVSLNRFHRNIASIEFRVQVEASGAQAGSLSGGQIAAIVVGSVVGFLLLCLLLLLCLWCCCFRRGICCCCCPRTQDKSDNFAKNTPGYSSTTNSKKHLTDFNSSANGLEVDDNSSGFHDLSESRPNYVISTISSRTGRGQFSPLGGGTFAQDAEVMDGDGAVTIDEYPLTNMNRLNVYNVQSNNQFSTDYQSSEINSNLYANKSSANNGFMAQDANYGYRLEAPVQRYVETTEYSSNHFVSDNDYEGRNEYRDEKMLNRVEYDANDFDQQYFMPDEYQKRANAYNKYDSDV